MDANDLGLEPRPAATLVILRDGPGGLEVLVTTRPKHLRFMGGAVVFPGGAVASADRDPRWEAASARPPQQAAALLGSEPIAAHAALVCALRESFEEVGFVIGTGPLDRLTRADARDPVTFLERCLELGIVLGTDALVSAGRWVTPLGAPVRFDARFFLVGAPAGWEPLPDPEEVEACRWVTPAEVLRELGAGNLLMAPPTVEMIQHLEAHGTVGDALESMPANGLDGPGRIISARLSPLVSVVLAPNPGLMTGPGTNTYVVGTGPRCVIDPGVEDQEHLDAVLSAAGEVSHILITHRHSDHVGGAAALARMTGAPVYAFGTDDAGDAPVAPIADGARIPVPGAELVALHTPGHASDHLCFLLKGAASMFSGDAILGEGTAVIAPPDGNMAAYMETLYRLSDESIDRIYPGHFRPLDGGNAVIDGYIRHRQERSTAILDALRDSGQGLSAEDVVGLVYTDTPPALHPVARLTVQAHLESLERDGQVERVKDRWTAVSGDYSE
ncbi:MAG: MBL fold metallo-hydrolase [Actinomycetota bacterium]|nr:MBL fold metallo-hydrolase [Actinomycetota bacterium]